MAVLGEQQRLATLPRKSPSRPVNLPQSPQANTQPAYLHSPIYFIYTLVYYPIHNQSVTQRDRCIQGHHIHNTKCVIEFGLPGISLCYGPLGSHSAPPSSGQKHGACWPQHPGRRCDSKVDFRLLSKGRATLVPRSPCPSVLNPTHKGARGLLGPSPRPAGTAPGTGHSPPLDGSATAGSTDSSGPHLSSMDWNYLMSSAQHFQGKVISPFYDKQHEIENLTFPRLSPVSGPRAGLRC